MLATLWVSVPLLSLLLAGCWGGVVGAVLTTMNYKLMRTSYSPRMRYALVGAVNAATILFFLTLVGMAALRER